MAGVQAALSRQKPDALPRCPPSLLGSGTEESTLYAVGTPLVDPYMDSRRKLIAHRDALVGETRVLAEQEIVANLLAHLPAPPCIVASYVSVAGEVSTDRLHNLLWEQGYQLALPRLHPVRTDQLIYLPFTQKTPLVRGAFNIPVPDQPLHLWIAPWECDVVIVPCVGFNDQCYRLGMGKGYYDKSFAFKTNKTTPLLYGLAFECQRSECIPQAWDIPCDAVFTESAALHKQESD